MNRDPFFSTQPARGWRPWGALVPVLAVLFVALPLLGMSLLLERLFLADAGGEPIGFAGLVAFLLLPFAAITLVVLVWVRFVVQAGAEEVLFRGWLLSALGRKFNAVVAVVVTCGVFAFVHYGPGQHWLMTLNMVLFSAFACGLALDSNHIWGVMGWHAGWNWLLATGFELPVTGLDAGVPAMIVALTPQGSAYLTGGADGPEGSIVCSMFFVGATVILTRRITSRRTVVR